MNKFYVLYGFKLIIFKEEEKSANEVDFLGKILLFHFFLNNNNKITKTCVIS